MKNEAKYDILSLDLSKDGSNKCGVWSSMGFEAFEILMLVLLALFLIYKVGRRVCGKDSLIVKRKAAKLQSDVRKLEKLKQRFETNGLCPNIDFAGHPPTPLPPPSDFCKIY